MSKDFRDLNFKVDTEFHRRFKLQAVMDGTTMVEVLKEAFQLYVEHRMRRR